MKPVYMWSTNQENYRGDGACHSVFQAVAEAILEENLIPGDEVWVSEMTPLAPPGFDEFMDVNFILESAEDYTSDNSSLEDCLIDPTREQRDELMKELSKTWESWHLRHPNMVTKYFEALSPKKFIVKSDKNTELTGSMA